MKESEIIFKEEQRFSGMLISFVVIGVAVFLISLFVQGMIQQLYHGRPWGDRPMTDTMLWIVGMLFILLSIALMYIFMTARLITQVRADGVYVRFIPFHRSFRRIPFDEMKSFKAVTCRPVMEYGGWGIRKNLKGTAYNVRGNRGVRIELENSKHLLLGSQKAGQLEDAMRRAAEAQKGE